MKILYSVDQFYLQGGIEKILAAKINSLIADYNVTVMLVTSYQRESRFVYPLDERLKYKDLGISYHEAESFFSPHNLAKKVQHYHLLKKEIRAFRPDVIISPSFSHDQYFLPFIERKIPKIKEVHFSGSILPEVSKLPSAITLATRFFRLFDLVILLNEDERKYFPRMPVEVIPNFTECNNDLNNNNKHKMKTVISAGRLAPVKQYDHLLKMWAIVSPKFPDWQLKIYGSGEENYVNHLKTLKDDLQLDTAEFAGAVKDLSVPMREASVFVMSSHNECFPMILLEAKCAGLPSVSYDASHGPRNIIKNGEDGLIVFPCTPDALAVALLKLLNDVDLRTKMSKEASQNSKEFSKEKVMKLWMNHFNKLIR